MKQFRSFLYEGALDKPTHSVEDIADKHERTEDFIKSQLAMGIEVELEHTSNKTTAREIALDHLWEKPDYYTRLKQVEK